MRTLMISLDVKILDPQSAVALRMIEYGRAGAIDIMIPCREKKEIRLSESVRVFGTGGAKWRRFFALVKLGKKLARENEYNLITAQDPFLTALAAIFIKKKIPLEIQVHGDFFGSDYFRNSGVKNFLYYSLARYVTLGQADLFRVAGERVKQSLVSFGADPAKITVRSVPINESEIRGRMPERDIQKEFPGFEKYFLYAGRLEKEKNVAWMIEMFDRYLRESKKNAVLIMAGDGTQKNYLRGMVHKLGRNKEIVFAGWIHNIVDYMKTADYLLSPSRAEGYGLSVMEAAAAGMRIIMTDTGVANYELKPSEKVRIVPVDDTAAFVAEMKKI